VGLVSGPSSPAAEESLASSRALPSTPAPGGRCSDEQPVIVNDAATNNQHDVNVRSFIITQSITGPFDASIRRKVTLPNDLREVNDNPMRAASGTAAGPPSRVAADRGSLLSSPPILRGMPRAPLLKISIMRPSR
jgi:hypothetical protein